MEANFPQEYKGAYGMHRPAISIVFRLNLKIPDEYQMSTIS